MSKNRKDDHLRLAKESNSLPNSFDNITLIHHSIPSFGVDDVSLATSILGKSFPYPFYINAMTGGSKLGNAINQKLAALADYFNLPFFLGSQSLAFKEEGNELIYQALREEYPNLFIVSNVNPNFTPEMAQKAVLMVKADALAIHVNSIQELVMLEGDRDFSLWSENIKKIVATSSVPVIVKEVGYGMHQVSLDHLASLGIKTIDISGTGGTNFTNIELKRRGEDTSPLMAFGLSTVESLRLAHKDGRFTVHASGGIKDAADIVKALALGANAVGMARYFLELAERPFAEMVEVVEKLILDLKKILVLLNVKTLDALNRDHLYFL